MECFKYPSSDLAYKWKHQLLSTLQKLCHEPKVIDEGLKHLTEALKSVTKLYEPLPPPGGSVLLAELVSAVSDTVSVSEAVASPTCTPLLHNLSAVQAYIKMFVHMCRLGQVRHMFVHTPLTR